MKYTETHEWVKLVGDVATVGITDHAQKELGEIVYIELPLKGSFVKKGEEGIVLESTKAAIDLYYPLSGTIVDVNTSLQENPEKINRSPERDGWFFKIKVDNKKEFESLLDADNYKKSL